MHVKSTSQNKFPMSLGTHRNKPHSKPLPEPPPATSPVSLGRQADGPRPTVGQSASRDLLDRASAQNTSPEFFMADSPRFTTRWSAVHFQILQRTDAFLELIPSLYCGRSALPDWTVRGYCSRASTVFGLSV